MEKAYKNLIEQTNDNFFSLEMMLKKEKIISFINTHLREYDVYDAELIDLLDAICKSAYEKGICNNKYLEELKKVKNE